MRYTIGLVCMHCDMQMHTGVVQSLAVIAAKPIPGNIKFMWSWRNCKLCFLRSNHCSVSLILYLNGSLTHRHRSVEQKVESWTKGSAKAKQKLVTAPSVQSRTCLLRRNESTHQSSGNMALVSNSKMIGVVTTIPLLVGHIAGLLWGIRISEQNFVNEKVAPGFRHVIHRSPYHIHEDYQKIVLVIVYIDC